MIKISNRYDDIFTFTKDDEGNILWEGVFTYCRIGYPNDYSQAYAEYLKIEGNPPHDRTLSLEQFKVEVHNQIYDSEGRWVSPVPVAEKYAPLVGSIRDKIDMVDPSGGPYIKSGMDMEKFSKEFKGMIVEEFQKIPTGYKIKCKKFE